MLHGVLMGCSPTQGQSHTENNNGQPVIGKSLNMDSPGPYESMLTMLATLNSDFDQTHA